MKPFALITALAALSLSQPLAGQENDLPYWASIDAEEARMRTGPGEQFPIAWVYRRQGLPLKVIRFHQGWRQVREPDGTEGWIFSGLLTRRRTAMVVGDGLAPMRENGTASATLRWNLEPGVIGILGDCEAEWCALEVDGHRGFVEQARLWGAGEP